MKNIFQNKNTHKHVPDNYLGHIITPKLYSKERNLCEGSIS